jgi:hypothetical protein
VKWRYLNLVILVHAVSVAACVMIQGPTLISSSGARITLLRHGKPLSATVDLYATRGPEWIYPARWSSSTDRAGTVDLPTLSPGAFALDFHFDKGKSADFRVEVSGSGEPGQRDVVFDIAPDPSANIPKDPATRAWLRQFAGTLQDVSGAVIPGGKISVRRKADPKGKNVAETITSQTGHFTLDLPLGDYIALFDKAGFAVEMVPFTLGDKGWQAFTLKMRLSGTDDCSPGSPSTQGELTELTQD